MKKHVTFDYSLANPFIGDEELDLMKESIGAARKTLQERTGLAMIFLVGLICRKTMTKRNLHGFRKQRIK